MAARFENYDSSREVFINWFERFTAHIAAESIEENDKVNYLVSCIGAETYGVLKRLALPKLPSEKSFSEIKSLLESHFSPKPLVVVQRFNFRRRVQAVNENFNSYLAALRELAATCEFNTPTPIVAEGANAAAVTAANRAYDSNQRLNEELRDQIILGIRDKDAQNYYLRTPDLTLKQVIDKAIGNELTGLGMVNLSTSGTSANSSATSNEPRINKVNERVRRKQFKSTPEKLNQGKVIKDNTVDVCYRCGRKNHRAPDCRFSSATCNTCKEVGHLATVCGKNHDEIRAAAVNRKKKPTKSAIKSVSSDMAVVDIGKVSAVTSNERQRGKTPPTDNEPPPPKIFLNLVVNETPITFEADCGSDFTFISLDNCKRFGLKKWCPARRVFQSYSHGDIELVGIASVKVRYKDTTLDLRLRVIDGNYDTIVGRDWLIPFKIDIRDHIDESSRVKAMNSSSLVSDSIADNVLLSQIMQLVEEFADIFKDEVSLIPDVEIDVPMKADAVPVFCRARSVPFALQSAVNDEIDRLVANGTYKPTMSSEWATPVVPVVKSNGSVRLVGDYSVTINRACIVKNYPIPNIEEIVTDFSGCEYFSKFDVREAYTRLKLSDAAAKLMTVHTQKGLFQPTSLMYGYTNAPAEWQQRMDQISKGIPGCRAFYDDAKISSKTASVHLKSLRLFFDACRKFNLRLNKDKCVFLNHQLDYLGFRVDKWGIHKTTEKIDAILKAKRPENAEQLKSFAGLVGYYSKFIPNCSQLFQPFAKLKERFVWTSECETAFEKIKKEIASDRVLCHFSPAKKLVLATDASPYALGAVLSHVDEKGIERPIAFASRTLTPTETRYSQLDRESLGIYWGVKKFFNYLYGRRFELLTDCQPLRAILDAKASKPSLSATRLLHYALFLQGFDYEIKYRKNQEHANADFPSRFPTSIGNPEQIDTPTYIHRVQLQKLPVTSVQIADETAKDSSIESLYLQLMGKQPIRKYREIQEYSLHDGCILRGERVYIPPPLRQQILEEIHLGHLGIVKCRQLARSFVYWNGIDKDIQNLIASCKECSDNAKNPAREVPHPWLPASGPWQRIHFDCGQLEEKQLFILVDAYSKWVECYVLTSITAEKLLECLDDCFARYGLPMVCVSDNAPQFVSKDFVEYFQTNGIKHLTSPPYSPSSNGQAEKFVQIIKSGLKSERNGSFMDRLNRVLLSYRRSPNITTGKSPAELFLNRTVRTKLSLVLPGEKSVVLKEVPTRRSFKIGEKVCFRIYNNAVRWSNGIITKKLGQVVYLIRDDVGNYQKRHVNQIKINAVPPPVPSVSITSNLEDEPVIVSPAASIPPPVADPVPPPVADPVPPPVADLGINPAPIQATPRPTRTRKAPMRYSP